MTTLPRNLTAAALSLFATAALAVGADDSDPPKPTETSTECAKGEVWDEKSGACVKADSSRLDDDARYAAARELAHAGRYDEAMIVLAAANPDDPRILNYKGFVHRKTGKMDAAMEFYRRALEIDPDYILARSYMGQGLAELGDMDGARAQLAEIRARGGRDTWAYVSLKQAITASGGY